MAAVREEALMAAEDERYGSIHSAMLHLTSHLAASTDVERTLASVTAAAVDLVDGVDYADVMLIEDGQFRSVVPSAPLVTELILVQQRLQQGPCLEAAVGDTMIRSNDLGKESRWPEFAAAAVAAGVSHPGPKSIATGGFPRNELPNALAPTVPERLV